MYDRPQNEQRSEIGHNAPRDLDLFANCREGDSGAGDERGEQKKSEFNYPLVVHVTRRLEIHCRGQRAGFGAGLGIPAPGLNR